MFNPKLAAAMRFQHECPSYMIPDYDVIALPSRSRHLWISRGQPARIPRIRIVFLRNPCSAWASANSNMMPGKRQKPTHATAGIKDREVYFQENIHKN
jgi:hypothetical protein